MRMRLPIILGVLLILVLAAQANATIIIFDSPSFVQPDEILLLNGAGLIMTGITVQGETNQSGTIFNITGSEVLTLPSNGQAQVVALSGNYVSAMFDADNPLLYFKLFEANLFVSGTPVITVGATEPDGSTTLYMYTGGNGQNFFGVKAIDGQWIDFITVSTAPVESIEYIKQIRIGGIGTPPTPAPEPTSLLLLGTGIGVLSLAAWRRKK